MNSLYCEDRRIFLIDTIILCVCGNVKIDVFP